MLFFVDEFARHVFDFYGKQLCPCCRMLHFFFNLIDVWIILGCQLSQPILKDDFFCYQLHFSKNNNACWIPFPMPFSYNKVVG